MHYPGGDSQPVDAWDNAEAVSFAAADDPVISDHNACQRGEDRRQKVHKGRENVQDTENREYSGDQASNACDHCPLLFRCSKDAHKVDPHHIEIGGVGRPGS